MTDGLPTYQPNARIVQNNRPLGFTTNINMETEDPNNIIDYSALANTMSSISRGALGTDKISTELHVVDNSASVDSHTMQRRFVEYLSR